MADSLFNLSDLNGSNGFIINGINANDANGTSVSDAGDVNGDGILDLIIGAPGAGKSYVIFGSSSGFSTNLDLSSLNGSNGIALNGSTSNFSGASVSSAGDVNGDNISDLIIGAPGAASGAGQSYVVFGSSSGLSASLDLSSLDGSNGFIINGINGVNSDGISDSSGNSVSSAGDVNGDDIDDLIIGARNAASGAGQSYVVFGSTSGLGASFNLSDLNGSNGFILNGNTSDSSGTSISSAGDVNADNIADLIIGAPGTGKSYVVFGSTSDLSTNLDLSSLNGSNGFAINGNASDFSGTSVSNAGDINNDGISDLIIGAYNGASGAGQSYVVFGSSNGFNANFDLSSLDGSNGFAINGINGTDVSGYSVSAAGDVNDDGIDDLIIGAPFGLSNAGQSYVVFGNSNGFGASLDLSNLDPSNGFAINGINANDTAGISVSAAGDVNGDGADDLLVGAPSAVSGAGQSYVIFGTPQPEPPQPPEPQPQPQLIFNLSDLNGSNGFIINGINANDANGTSVSDAGDVNGDGILDLIIGAPGAGKSYVIFGSSSGFSTNLDLSSLNGSNGIALNGSTSNFSGASVSSAGDVNGDNISDLIIGAPGAASGAGQSYVVFGSSSGLSASLDLSSLDGSNGFILNGINGVNSDGISDSSGNSVSSAGDVNGDNISDLIIGARNAASGAGQSYVVFGSTSGLGASFNLSDLNGSNGFILNGNTSDSSGTSVSSAGDVNADNIADLIIGAPGTGKSYVVFGSTSDLSTNLDLSSLNGSNGFAINGNASDFSGTSVSNAGDINNDGISDLIIGAYNGASGAGQSYVVFGSSNGFNANFDLSSLDGSNGFAINGINGTDVSGYSVSAAGDVNDDGIDDLIIGAPFGLSNAGQSYVVFGNSNGFGASLDLSNLDPSNGFAINGINANDTAGISVSAAGDVNGDGADDLLVGAPSAVSGAGQSYVIFGTPQPEPPQPPEPQPQPQLIFNLSDLNGSNGFIINGINANDANGTSVSDAGDVNGDGILDLIIGAPGAGKSYVIFGSSSGFSTNLDLSSLNGSNGIALNGSTSNFSGASVSSAGDVNGDNISDLIIGAPGAASGAGQSYVVFGSSSGLSASLDLSSLDGSNGFIINGINGVNSDGISDSSGNSVSSAGDVNGDDIDDLIIGARNAASGAGQSYVVFGSTSSLGASFNLSDLNGSNGFILNGNTSDSSGTSVSSAGDVNADNIADLIIGAPGTGKSYVVFGSTSDWNTNLDLSSLNGSNGFAINGNASDFSGTSVSNAGDINDDGISDLIIGAYNGASGAGQSYVVFGSSNGFNANFDLSSLDGSNGFAINGINGTDVSGYSVSAAGDVNDDGIDDLIIGAPFGLSNAGQSYVVFGNSNGFGASLDLSNLDPSNGFAINGINANDTAGISVSAAGDVNGDGADDLLVGAPSAVSGAGQSYVIFGTPQPEPPQPPEPQPQPQLIFNLSDLNGSNGFIINGINANDANGTSVSDAGDVNGDGILDLIIGAPGAGKSYVIFGSSSGFSTNLDLSSLNGSNGIALNGSTSNFSGASVSSAGDVNGDNISDLIIGAPGAASGAGQSYVVFGSSSGLSASLDLSSLDGSNGFIINGINGVNSDGISDSSGNSVSSAGDVNGDDIDDLIIGARNAASGAGQSYVVFGSTSSLGASFNLSDLNGSNGFILNGNTSDSSGTSVSSAGDVNADNIADLIIGAPGTGKSYVVFGSTSDLSTNLDLSSLNGSNGFAINGNASDFSGTSVSNAGDINNDGISDLIIGAYNGASGAGQSYVVFGSSNGFNANFDLSSLDGSNGFAINGINGTDVSGYSVSAAGDVNDDGIDDLIIGAPFGLSNAGQSYVVFGNSNGFGASLDLSNLDPSNGFAINGINANDTAGISVSAAGDVNGDGADDLLVGAPSAVSGAGQSYVIFGTPQIEPPKPPEPLELTNSGDVFNIKGDNDNVTLNVAITGSNSRLVNEFGVYAVDDATGKIDGIAPGEAGYARKALERGQVILSTIANPPNGFSNSSLNSLLEFPSDSNLRFYLVKNSTTENVLSNITPISDVLFSDASNQRITSLDNNAFSLAWKDGSGNSTNDFQNLVVKIQSTNDPLPLGANLQSQPQKELIDLRDVQQRVTANFAVNREAAFDNFVGFYKVADENGGIDTNNDGKADILVGQAGYAQAAVRQRVAGIDLLVNNQGTATFTDTFEPGSIFAPFIITNGRPDAILDSNPNNNPAVYFSFLGANADKVDHIRLLGNNTFGFEDLAGGGDKDFNDVIVRANLSIG